MNVGKSWRAGSSDTNRGVASAPEKTVALGRRGNNSRYLSFPPPACGNFGNSASGETGSPTSKSFFASAGRREAPAASSVKRIGVRNIHILNPVMQLRRRREQSLKVQSIKTAIRQIVTRAPFGIIFAAGATSKS